MYVYKPKMLRSHDLLLTLAAFFLLYGSIIKRASDSSDGQASALTLFNNITIDNNDDFDNQHDQKQQQIALRDLHQKEQLLQIKKDVAYVQADVQADVQANVKSAIESIFELDDYLNWFSRRRSDNLIVTLLEYFFAWQCILILIVPVCDPKEFLELLVLSTAVNNHFINVSNQQLQLEQQQQPHYTLQIQIPAL